MGLFGNRKPPLPSYVEVDLEALLQDPNWAYAISRAGIDPNACEIVLRLAGPMVGSGIGVPEVARPAILFGQGHTLAIAHPEGRDIKVIKRDKSRAELQTQRSGWFQILFGPVSQMDGFMFWDPADNLKLGTPEGDTFGPIMSAFLNGQLKSQQVIGTPQSLVAGSVSAEPATPSLDDPEDVIRWRQLHSLKAALDEMMNMNQECFDKAELAEKAITLANADYVDGVRQHEASKNTFRRHGEDIDRELAGMLGRLREVTLAAQSKWKDFVFLLPGSEDDVFRIMNWCETHNIDSNVWSSVVANGAFIYTDFGLTRESFWAENERVAEIMKKQTGNS